MKFFYLSSIPSESGFFLVHERECKDIPDPMNRDYLGPFNNGDEALRKALTLNSKALKCENCCCRQSLTIHSIKKEQ
jgi:hypothetical protein